MRALCDLGRVVDIDCIVGVMEKEGLALDVVFYSCWALGHIRRGVLMEALRKNRRMLGEGIAADVVSYTSLMDGFSRVASVGKALGFLAKMRDEGIKPTTVTHTTVILGLCRQGKFIEAFDIFKAIKDQGELLDEYIYAILLDAACKNGYFELVHVLLCEMEKKGVTPGVVTHNIIISRLCRSGRTSEADNFSREIVGDVFTYSALLNGYIREKNFQGVCDIKNRFEKCGLKMDVVMCNVLIKASFMVGAFEDASALYRKMADLELTASLDTYYALINGFLTAGRVDEALEIFDQFKVTSISSARCYNCVIEGLCLRGLVDMAFKVILELFEKNLAADLESSVTFIEAVFEKEGAEGVLRFLNKFKKLTVASYVPLYDQAIYYLCKKGHVYPSLEAYLSMGINNYLITRESLFSILKGLAGFGKEKIGWPLLGFFTKIFGFVDNEVKKILVEYVFLQNVTIGIYFISKMKAENLEIALPISVFKMLMKHGRIIDAYQLVIGEVDCIPALDVADFTMFIDGLFKRGFVHQALSICSFLQKKAISLNIVFYNTVINGLCHQGRLIEAFRLYDSLEHIGLAPSDVTFGTLIDALCREQFLHDAELLMGKMILHGYIPNTHAYSSLIISYSKIGKFDSALKVFKELEIRGVKADEFTVSALLNAYGQKGDMEGALELYTEFKRKGILPDYLGFLHLVRGLTSKGRLEETQSILRQMLQLRPIVELIDKIDSEVGAESLHSFLVQLCEQGNIKAACTVLNEIGYTIRPSPRFCVDNDSLQEQSKPFVDDASRIDAAAISLMPVGSVESCAGDLGVEDTVEALTYGKGTQIEEFNSLYPLVVSLCSSGEVQKANQLLRQTFR